MKTSRKIKEETGASEGIRTLDIHLGKVTLYRTELRSLPKAVAQSTKFSRFGKSDFQTKFDADKWMRFDFPPVRRVKLRA